MNNPQSEKSCGCVYGLDYSKGTFNTDEGWKGVVPCSHNQPESNSGIKVYKCSQCGSNCELRSTAWPEDYLNGQLCAGSKWEDISEIERKNT